MPHTTCTRGEMDITDDFGSSVAGSSPAGCTAVNKKPYECVVFCLSKQSINSIISAIPRGYSLVV